MKSIHPPAAVSSRLSFVIGFCFLFLLPVLVGGQTDATPTLDQIVARHIAARGGYEKIHGMKTLLTRGILSLGPRGEAKLTREIKRPGMVRTEFQLGPVTLVHAYDGKVGWEISPEGKPVEMTGDNLANAIEDADIEGPLVDYKQKGNKVELVGSSSINDARCYNLKVTFPNSDVIYECLDAKTYLAVGQRVERHGEVIVEAVLGGYSDFEGGIKLAGTSDIKQAGNPDPIHFKLQSAVINGHIDDARFHMPAQP